MKLTKKQISALKRIIAREEQRNWKNRNAITKIADPSGLHPSGERFVVTDGVVAVYFNERPDTGIFPEAERTDFFDEFERNFNENSDMALAATAPTAEQCRQTIREWKKSTAPDKPDCPIVEVIGKLEQGWGYGPIQISANYDARLMLDALESIGAGAMVYIGKDRNARYAHPIVTVYGSNGRGEWRSPDFDGARAIVLPLRK